MFVGFATLDQNFVSYLVTKDSDDSPMLPDAYPTWQVYGPDGPMTNGSGTAEPLPGVVGMYRVVIPVMGANGYELGTSYKTIVSLTMDGEARVLEQSFVVT